MSQRHLKFSALPEGEVVLQAVYHEAQSAVWAPAGSLLDEGVKAILIHLGNKFFALRSMFRPWTS